LFIRTLGGSDPKLLYQLFYDTVHTVNRADYTPEQLDAWAPPKGDAARWRSSLRQNDTLLAVEEDRIIGFGDLTQAGYFDHLYVHKDYQRRGVATLLADALEERARQKNICTITTAASITARPFFLKRGYHVLKEQHVECNRLLLTNFLMEKPLKTLAENDAPPSFLPMRTQWAEEILRWQYPEPYALYNHPLGADTAEWLGESYFVRLDGEGRPAGFVCFGQPARIRTAEDGVYTGDALDIGLGLRPDLCGRGHGAAYLSDALAFARLRFGAARFRLSVASFNFRAKRAYEHAGFCVEREVRQLPSGLPFTVMEMY
jgi:putative acetyltransferase